MSPVVNEGQNTSDADPVVRSTFGEAARAGASPVLNGGGRPRASSIEESIATIAELLDTASGVAEMAANLRTRLSLLEGKMVGRWPAPTNGATEAAHPDNLAETLREAYAALAECQVTLTRLGA